MFLFTPEKSQKYSKKVKTDKIFKISKKQFQNYRKRYYPDMPSPYNIKHLNYNGDKKRFFEYFQKVNESISLANYFNRNHASYSHSILIELLEPIDLEQIDRNVDSFNIMMKEKLGCPTSKDFYIKKKEKNKKLRTCGSIRKCLYECILD